MQPSLLKLWIITKPPVKTLFSLSKYGMHTFYECPGETLWSKREEVSGAWWRKTCSEKISTTGELEDAAILLVCTHKKSYNTMCKFFASEEFMLFYFISCYSQHIYSLVPIRSHGSINRHTSFIWPRTFSNTLLLFGSILNFEALPEAPLIKTT